jgi:hypothetical protein
MRDAELGEDKPGRAFAGAGAMQRSAMERDGKDDGPKEHARRGGGGSRCGDQSCIENPTSGCLNCNLLHGNEGILSDIRLTFYKHQFLWLKSS